MSYEFSTTGWKDLLKKKSYKDDSLVCVYKPRIQVLDNWGWCSGACQDSGGSAVKGVDQRPGCYNDGNFSNQCDDLNNNSQRFVDFSNIVVVAP